MRSIEVKGTARTIAERSSDQARALKAIRKKTTVYLAYFMVAVKMFTWLKYRQKVCVIWYILLIST